MKMRQGRSHVDGRTHSLKCHGACEKTGYVIRWGILCERIRRRMMVRIKPVSDLLV